MKVFIDGQAGTTGLQLEGRLRQRNANDIGCVELLEIDPALRKNPSAKKELINKADVVFLCLPDDEARISAQMASENTLVIDASTAHRTVKGWAYGLPELSNKHRNAIAGGKRIAVPGCHACGFNAIMFPLVSAGLIDSKSQIHCTSLTGYSGGGRGMIETYESAKRNDRLGSNLSAPRPYALGLTHKHLPEMVAVSGLQNTPHFYPVIGDMAQGMIVSVHLWSDPLRLYEILSDHYKDAHFIKVKRPEEAEEVKEAGFLDPTACNGTNSMEIFVFGNDKQQIVAARFDNLGKGASGSAVQCMNIAMGLDETL